MDHSFTGRIHLACPSCGEAVSVGLWFTIDLDERPDLAAAARSGTLHQARCPRCQKVARWNAPLLICAPLSTSACIFVPADDDGEFDRLCQRAADRIERARPVGGQFADAWGAPLFIVPSITVPHLLSPHAAPVKVFQIAAAVEAEIARQNAAAGTGLDRLRDAITERVSVLHLLPQLVKTPAGPELRQLLVAHPKLLGTQAEYVLRDLAVKQPDRTARELVDMRRVLLGRCREIGIDACFAEQADMLRLPKVSADVAQRLGKALIDIARPRVPAELPRQIELIRWVQQFFPRHENPYMWAVEQQTLAIALVESQSGDASDNIDQAIASYEAALEVRTRAAGLYEWSETLNNLGNALRMRRRGNQDENLERAIACFGQALEFRTRDAWPIRWSMTTMNLGLAYAALQSGNRADNIERAIDCLEQAASVQASETERTQWALTMHNLGGLYRDRPTGVRGSNIERSIDASQQALEVRTRDRMPFEWATTTRQLAQSYAERKVGSSAENEAIAIQLLEESLEVLDENAFPAERREAAAVLGDVRFRRAEWSEAAEAFDKAVRAAHVVYVRTLLPGDRETEIARSGELHTRATWALARANCAQQAAVMLERGLSRILGEALDRDRSDLENLRQTQPDAYELYRRAAIHARSLEASLRRTVDNATGTPVQHAELRDQALQVRAEFDAAVAGIRNLDGYRMFLEEPDLATIHDAVTPEQPLAYLLITDDGALLLLAHRTAEALDVDTLWTDNPARYDVVSLMLQRDSAAPVGAYLPLQGYTVTWSEAALTQALQLLGRLVEPLAARLRELGLSEVVLLPTGLLRLLPIHAAEYSVQGQRQLLMQEFDVSYAPAARVLTVVRSGRPDGAHVAKTQTLSGVGNPLDNPQPLAFARTEIELVSNVFDGRSTVLVEHAATKDQFVKIVQGASHVHLACHAVFDPLQPLKSHIQLAGPDGLSLAELMDTQLLSGVSLIILSACQTAMTDVFQLPDEAIGLPVGCLYAGASRVVGTLWPIDDMSTSLLMEQLYTRLRPARGKHDSEGPRLTTALRSAQEWLRTVTAGQLMSAAEHSPAWPDSLRVAVMARCAFLDDQEPPFASPLYWASFVVVCD